MIMRDAQLRQILSWLSVYMFDAYGVNLIGQNAIQIIAFIRANSLRCCASKEGEVIYGNAVTIKCVNAKTSYKY